jgi:hypothetical protein
LIFPHIRKSHKRLFFLNIKLISKKIKIAISVSDSVV